jgi:hypothetical protein
VGGAAVPGMTTAEQVRRFLAENRAASMEQVRSATGLGEQQVRRTPAWKDHEGPILNNYLKDHPEAHTGDVAQALGFSPAKTRGMRSWKDHQARRATAKPPPRIKERSLTQPMLTCRADGNSAAPGARAEQCDEVLRTIWELADPDTKARLKQLTSAHQAALVEHVVRQMDDGASECRDEQRSRTILLSVAESWLEEHEQERRHQDRRQR